MKREAIFESWVPSGGMWSLWARPILFAQMNDSETEQRSDDAWLAFEMNWIPEVGDKVVVIVDLPGAESVRVGLDLAGRGFRPVPLYNACTGPHEVIDQSPILDMLRAGADYLASLARVDGPPAFLLDARRMSPVQVQPRDFDNRWKVFPQDFPSAAFLIGRGYRRALLIQRNRAEPAEDLAHVLRRWQDAGMILECKNLANATLPAAIAVDRPEWYRSVWQRVLTIVGLRRSPQGGFGAVVPEPNSSHG